jgi:hypothetical protein
MPLFLLTAGSGWLAALLLGVTVCVPYAMRSRCGGLGASLSRFRLHYVLGLVVVTVAFLHAWLPMSVGRMRASDQAGLLLASVALCILLWQVALGFSLRAARGADLSPRRRLHFWTMALIVGLVATHIVLNRA